MAFSVQTLQLRPPQCINMRCKLTAKMKRKKQHLENFVFRLKIRWAQYKEHPSFALAQWQSIDVQSTQIVDVNGKMHLTMRLTCCLHFPNNVFQWSCIEYEQWPHILMICMAIVLIINDLEMQVCTKRNLFADNFAFHSLGSSDLKTAKFRRL